MNDKDRAWLEYQADVKAANDKCLKRLTAATERYYRALAKLTKPVNPKPKQPARAAVKVKAKKR